MQHRKRSRSLLTLLLTALLFVAGTTSASAQELPDTEFGFRGFGFSSLVTTGPLSGQSGRTGFSALACTNQTGVENSNAIAQVDLGTLIEVSEGETTNQSIEYPNGSVHSLTINTIESVRIGNALSYVEVTGLEQVARAWYKDGTFFKKTNTQAADVNLVLAGTATPLSVDAFLDDGVTLPGIATITASGSRGFAGADGARALGTSLQVDLLGSTASVVIGRAWASVERLPDRPFAGYAYGVRADAAEGIVRLGPVAHQGMPCAGTDGEYRETAVASTNRGLVQAGAVSTRILGDPRVDDPTSIARGEADVADVNIGSGLVQIDALHTEAVLLRRANGSYVRGRNRTTLAGLSVGGDDYTLDAFVDGELEVPGVARLVLDDFVAYPLGMQVTGLHVELLDGSGASIDVGQVRLLIK